MYFVLSLGGPWSTGANRCTRHCGSAGKVHRKNVIVLKYQKCFKLSPLRFLQRCVSGPTWSKRFTRSNGTCRRQSKPLFITLYLLYPCCLSLYRHLNVYRDILFELNLCFSVGPAWLQRQARHCRHHWQDSESFLVCLTAVTRASLIGDSKPV